MEAAAEGEEEELEHLVALRSLDVVTTKDGDGEIVLAAVLDRAINKHHYVVVDREKQKEGETTTCK